MKDFKVGDRVVIHCPWKKKLNGLTGTITQRNHKLTWVKTDTGRVVATKHGNIAELDLLDRLADAL